jgi:hypothetical protein
MAHRTVGAGQSVTTGSSNQKSDAIAVKSSVLRITARGNDVHVAIGTEPVATETDYIIPAGTSETLGVTKASQRVRSITSSSGKTIVTCPEGTQQPFGVGDCVTLETNQADSNWATVISHVGVDSIDTSADFEGSFSTKVTLSADTSGISTAFSDTDATLRRSIKVGAVANGPGSIFVQQVQTTGAA